jgi:hypothetical protein
MIRQRAWLSWRPHARPRSSLNKPPAGGPGDTTPAAKHQAAMAEWKSKILPAAKKEGEVIWYSCAQATEAEGTIRFSTRRIPTSR